MCLDKYAGQLRFAGCGAFHDLRLAYCGPRRVGVSSVAHTVFNNINQAPTALSGYQEWKKAHGNSKDDDDLHNPNGV
jgi:hypothetical protein